MQANVFVQEMSHMKVEMFSSFSQDSELSSSRGGAWCSKRHQCCSYKAVDTCSKAAWLARGSASCPRLSAIYTINPVSQLAVLCFLP